MNYCDTSGLFLTDLYIVIARSASDVAIYG